MAWIKLKNDDSIPINETIGEVNNLIEGMEPQDHDFIPVTRNGMGGHLMLIALSEIRSIEG